MRAPAWFATLTAAAALLVVPASGQASTACPWLGSTAAPLTKANQVLARLTFTEKVQLVSGAPQTGPSAGVIKGVPRLCIPGLVLNDASAGIGNRQTGTTAFPDEIAQTASWDPALQQSMGRALGAEAVAKGVNVVFGPGVNLARNPLNGRGFEYAGEDPFLAGRTAASLVQGIQSQHVIATVKHLAYNEQETNRTTSSSDVGERTAAELYLAPFEAAVKAGAGSVMCSYNRVGGTHACQHSPLLNGVLKHRFGFTGFVASDFMATHSTSAATAGLDMELPQARFFGANLRNVSPTRLDDMVRRVLVSMFRIGLVDHPVTAPRATATTAATLAVATRVAQQGSVLLKNTGSALPLTSAVKRIAVIGPAASLDGAKRASQGYGSAHVPQFALHDKVVAPLAAITARAQQAGATVTYADGSNLAQALIAAATSDVSIVLVNDVNNEGIDRPDLTPRTGECSLTGQSTCSYSSLDQDQLVSTVAAASPRTVVVLQTGGPVEMPWLGQVEAVVENWLPGQVDGAALAPLLYGDVNFSGKLPVTFPVALADGPLRSAAQYPGVNDSRGIPRVSYSEGLLMGYRWYDAKGIAPMFPFGHGLSYTRFNQSRLRLTPTASGVTAQVTVNNIGSRTGAEVVQVYVSAPASAGEPPRTLAGFAKVTLKPGETRTVSIPISTRAFSVWSTLKHTWVPVKGCFGVRAGSSSRNLPLSARVARAGGTC